MTWLWITAAVVLIAAGALVPAIFGRQRQRLCANDEAVAARRTRRRTSSWRSGSARRASPWSPDPGEPDFDH
jgi:hypothetical protein